MRKLLNNLVLKLIVLIHPVLLANLLCPPILFYVLRSIQRQLCRSGCLIHNGTYLTLSLTLTIMLTLLTLTVTVSLTTRLTVLTVLTLIAY